MDKIEKTPSPKKTVATKTKAKTKTRVKTTVITLVAIGVSLALGFATYQSLKNSGILKPQVAKVERCYDEQDNDGDGLIDCQDPNCASEAACLVQQGTVALVAGGEAQAEIIYKNPNGQTNIARDAANDLQAIIKRISEVELAVLTQPSGTKKTEIHIGYTDKINELVNTNSLYYGVPLSQYSEDGYSYVTVKEDSSTYIPIQGKSDTVLNEGGLRYAVRSFAEEYFGVRWFLPGDDPTNPGNYWSYYPISKNVGIKEINVPKSGVMPVEPAFQSRALSGANLSLFPQDVDWYNRNKLAARYDVSHNECNIHNIPCDQHINFTEQSRKDQAKQAVENYFSDPNNSYKESFSLVIDDSLNYPDANYYPAGSTDASKAVFEYTNYAAEGAPEGKYVTQLSYQRTENPEHSPLVNKKVIPYITLDTSLLIDSGIRQAQQTRVNGWKSKSQNLGLYDYAYGAPMLIPRFDPSVSKQALLDFYNNVSGKRGYYAEAYPNWALDGLKNYIVAKLLWNPNLDEQAMVNEFCEKMFGKGSEKMKEYFVLLEKTWTNSTPAEIQKLTNTPSLRSNINQLAIVSPAEIAALLGKLDEAKALAAGDNYAVARIETIKTQLAYLEKWVKIYNNVVALSDISEQELKTKDSEAYVNMFLQAASDLASRPDLQAINSLTGITLTPRVTSDYASLMGHYNYDYEGLFSNALFLMDYLLDNGREDLASKLVGMSRGASLDNPSVLDTYKAGIAIRYLEKKGQTTKIDIPKNNFDVSNIGELRSQYSWHSGPQYQQYQAVEESKVNSDNPEHILALWGAGVNAGSNYVDYSVNDPGRYDLKQNQYYYFSTKSQMKRVKERAGDSNYYIELQAYGKSSSYDLRRSHYNRWLNKTMIFPGLSKNGNDIGNLRLFLYAKDQYQPAWQSVEESDKAMYDYVNIGVVNKDDLEKILNPS